MYHFSKSNLSIALLLTIGTALFSNNLPAFGQDPALVDPVPKEMGRRLQPNRSVLPKPVARKLLQTIAKETNLPVSSLKITDAKPFEFGGCLDIYEGPTQVCTANIISGWKAIVTGPSQTYVYHLDRNATRIRRNPTASGAKLAVRVSFIQADSFSPIASTEVFSSSTSGDLAGRMTRTVLTQDGKITLYQSSPTARFAPQVIKTLSPAQIAAFKQTLDNQRFPNFNGLSYLTSAAVADYPTTTYQTPYTTVQFIDLEKKSFPRSLRRVISTWETLIQVNR